MQIEKNAQMHIRWTRKKTGIEYHTWSYISADLKMWGEDQYQSQWDHLISHLSDFYWRELHSCLVFSRENAAYVEVGSILNLTSRSWWCARNHSLPNRFERKIKSNKSLGLKESLEREIISFFLSKYHFVLFFFLRNYIIKLNFLYVCLYVTKYLEK